MQTVALAPKRCRCRRRSGFQCGEDVSELRHAFGPQPLEVLRMEGIEFGLDRVDHDGVRDLLLELRASSVQYADTAGGGSGLELDQQARLTDSRLTRDRKCR